MAASISASFFGEEGLAGEQRLACAEPKRDGEQQGT
jgi:hypothetical protein